MPQTPSPPIVYHVLIFLTGLTIEDNHKILFAAKWHQILESDLLVFSGSYNSTCFHQIYTRLQIN